MNRSIILAAIIISTAILLNGYLNRANRAPQVGRSSQKPVPSVRDKSIAVLPFENLSNDPQTADFADGIQQEIINRLTKVHDLKVVSQSDVMRYKDAARRDLRDIGEHLGAANLAEGRVGRSDNRVRVTIQLVDAKTQAQFWAETYDYEIADVPAVEIRIAEQVAEALGVKLSSGEKIAIEEGRGNH